MTDTITTLIIAGHTDRDSAVADYELLRNTELDFFSLIDAAVVEHDADGNVNIEKDMHHPVAKGLLIGGVVAVLSPVALVAGVIGGGIVGGLVSHFHKGLSRKDIAELGELLDRSTFAVIAIAAGADTPEVAKCLSTTDVVVKRMAGSEAAYRNLLDEYDSVGGR